MDDKDLIEYYKAIFEQVKLQQEVRDKWTNYYLIVTGAVIAISGTVFKVFQSSSREMFYTLAFLSFSAFVIGSLFFLIYLRQRLNYQKLYKLLDGVQKRLLKNENELLELTQSPPHFGMSKYGADFYGVWFHIFVNSLYVSWGVLWLYFSQQKAVDFSFCSFIVGVVIFLISSTIFELVRRSLWEN